jgi:hypothetical protein
MVMRVEKVLKPSAHCEVHVRSISAKERLAYIGSLMQSICQIMTQHIHTNCGKQCEST